MDDSVSPENNPWGDLSTVTTFDRGNDTWTTYRMDDCKEVQAGGQVVGRVSPSTSLLVEALIQQLCTLFEGDPVRRNKLYYAICDKLHEMKLIDGSYNMEELELVRSQYQRALFHLVTVARASTGSESALQVPSSLMTEWSRYRHEFEEIGFISKGGFGNVFKARHRLDGTEYAIKKVVVPSCRVQNIMRYLKEVKTLATLNHPNIVPYKGAWIEQTLLVPFVQNASPECSDKYGLHISEKLSCSRSRKNRKNGRANYSSHSEVKINLSKSRKTGGKINKGLHIPSLSISSTNHMDCRMLDSDVDVNIAEKSYSSVVSFRGDYESNKSYSKESSRHLTLDSNSNDEEASEDSESFEESVSEQQICQYNSKMNQNLYTLYIQMALCERTLREWLDDRVEPVSQPLVTVILTQILSGLDYIHSRGVVHHDIKPSNIFISTIDHLTVQLGDFGLACALQKKNHHSVFGTHMYAAPEQLRGKCNPKSDIFSLGIVLLELIMLMKTRMERSKIIGALQAGQIPDTLKMNHPKWAFILSQLVQTDPNARPTTKQLLQELSEDKDLMIAKLRNDNNEKSIIIQKQQSKLEQQELEIARLKKLLENS
ncbi:eukaryotic translation initiation factor 2-alpha kinase 1-like [Neodiprion virginianus]|uniref:eukaryotic translation initiation factor 2-alpha kinase 1-like n=1 Tax=Neodiprion fabricii TaxID=2872261 RepID=UPI001ED94229|nr:eukaryotic translation initiation factor 2-alpha kinase 1-like [Neodiprion fabricii]XP_046606712.1 eukaryotic translation initiation factor 2-alpha kinase 1-like [Neodiprion virginianus]